MVMGVTFEEDDGCDKNCECTVYTSTAREYLLHHHPHKQKRVDLNATLTRGGHPTTLTLHHVLLLVPAAGSVLSRVRFWNSQTLDDLSRSPRREAICSASRQRVHRLLLRIGNIRQRSPETPLLASKEAKAYVWPPQLSGQHVFRDLLCKRAGILHPIATKRKSNRQFHKTTAPRKPHEEFTYKLICASKARVIGTGAALARIWCETAVRIKSNKHRIECCTLWSVFPGSKA